MLNFLILLRDGNRWFVWDLIQFIASFINISFTLQKADVIYLIAKSWKRNKLGGLILFTIYQSDLAGL